MDILTWSGPASQRLVRLVLSPLLLLALNSCTIDGAAQDRGSSWRLVRTPLQEWETREFPEAGLRLDYPVAAFRASDSVFGVGIGLHPVYPPRGMLSDAGIRIQIYIERLSQEEARRKQENIEGTEQYATDPARRSYWRWLRAWHEVPEFYEDASGGAVYRYDLRCQDTTVVWMDAELVSFAEKPASERAADKQAVVRILESVECLSGWEPPGQL